MPNGRHYDALREHLKAFLDFALESANYDDVAAFFNRCRAKGVQGSKDFLICADAALRQFAILTTDSDFTQSAKVLPIQSHLTRSAVSR